MSRSRAKIAAVPTTGDHRTDPTTETVESGTTGHRHGPFVFGFLFTVGALLAYWLGGLLLAVGNILVLVGVALFLAVGLHPLVEWFVRRRIPRQASICLVIGLVLLGLTLFLLAVVPVITEQVRAIISNAPDWLRQLQDNERIQDFENRYGILDKVQDGLTSGNWTTGLFGGVIGVGLAVLSMMTNVFIVTVLTLYFLASLDKTKETLYQFVPASRRERVTDLSERMLDGIGGYVIGAFAVALCAGATSFVFLLIVGLGTYAVALSVLVALLDVVPMIGATIGAVAVTAIGFATDPKVGWACLIFYLIYQQVENYLIYPRVMKRSVNVPGAVTVIAALIGAGLLGVVGAMLAVPVAAAILLLVKEVWLPRQQTC